MSQNDVSNTQILDEVKSLAGGVNDLKIMFVSLSGSVTSLSRQVDRMDQRLGNVEHYIRFIASAVGEQSSDLDDHEKRISRLEQLRAN